MSQHNVHDVRTSAANQYVTVRIGGQRFGLPIAAVHEVFVPEQVTRVPLAPKEVEGVLNLRGRIVTTIDLRQLLGFPPSDAKEKMAVGIEYKSESFGLIIDEVGEVMHLEEALEPCPPNLDPRWAEIVKGVYHVSGELMLILDVEAALARVTVALAA
ncbi:MULTISPECIES: chemotaxis protein CheW [Afifella]|uniref:Purine-binding chemotaxis protein CheW n=1 Tax=Afifella marina DSM 2698 TaxID=1120955 RepID=A0A1G5MW24_AFIMA|nr:MULTISPECIES: chemotaxis protein CheW [Afifella]MBK1622006.1 chemotaxis protein CheW [Afifella marina DSM 2698]MBK1627799.1 chemotaxis protein CheW [Afifella marina]MBK5916766.1 chemotaxis protein CheW [Afifella marina]RAI19908.1 chemotaxis protein CheW [Afifella marina DSM 2698]SCZ28741.1 purine-binding chemotaxis protein CheW [Afifella marina DSM 2698]